MRVIVCGGRDYGGEAIDTVMGALDRENVTIVHGDARGADMLAGACAEHRGMTVERHPADWKAHGKAAGHIRNKAMLDAGADLVIAFPGGKGTDGMCRIAYEAGVPVLRVYAK